MKKFTLRLDDKSEKYLDELLAFYNAKGPLSFSYQDIIKLSLRALYEDCGLDEGGSHEN